MGLNDTQASVLAMVFKYCDDRRLPLLDFKDLRAVLNHLTGAGAETLRDYGGHLEGLGRRAPARDGGAGAAGRGPLLRRARAGDRRSPAAAPDGRGRISVLELADVQDKPALFSTFMMWMLAELYHQLPEVGDLDKPKLVFFFDEAHLLFDDASKAFLEQVEQVVRLVRSKGVGIFFVTQSPKDVPPAILGQLGQPRAARAARLHPRRREGAARGGAHLPEDAVLRRPGTLTTLGIGEALVTVLSPSAARRAHRSSTASSPPASRMGPLTDEERAPLLAHRAGAEVRGRRRSRERLRDPGRPPRRRRARRARTNGAGRPGPQPPARPSGSAWSEALNSPVARTIANQVTRGLMGALLGKPPRRHTRRSAW